MSGEEEETDAVHLIRHWKDLDSSVFRGKVPSREQIEKWKRAFEMANPKDTAWRFEVAYFKDKDHYQAVRDFIEIWHGQDAPEEDEERTEWRILQWDPGFDDMPGAGAGGSFSGLSATRVSVVRTMAAMEAAFCRAERVTLAGSTIPAWIMST